jgi:DNA repair protein RadC
MNYNPKSPRWALAEVKAKYECISACAFEGKVNSSRDACEYIKTNIPEFVEELEWRENFGVIFLSRSNKIIGHKIVSSGGVSGTVVDPKIVFQHALICNSSGIIIFHNHPSGNTSPSGSDKTITSRLSQAGTFLEINVLDHLIITQNSYFSFADEGIL